jgi:adenylylsulfate kinase-like enzyme
MIYWFTGQPGHGKTVLASALKQELDNTFHIDGDDLRAIFDNKDYSEAGRRKNIELAQQLAHFLHNKNNFTTLCKTWPHFTNTSNSFFYHVTKLNKTVHIFQTKQNTILNCFTMST